MYNYIFSISFFKHWDVKSVGTAYCLLTALDNNVSIKIVTTTNAKNKIKLSLERVKVLILLGNGRRL